MVAPGRPAAFTYAAVRSDFACAAAPLVRSITAGATTVPGPPGSANPVIDDPGESPRLPWRTLGPVLVTVDPARTE